jgi:hypothetical protein
LSSDLQEQNSGMYERKSKLLDEQPDFIEVLLFSIVTDFYFPIIKELFSI